MRDDWQEIQNARVRASEAQRDLDYRESRINALEERIRRLEERLDEGA